MFGCIRMCNLISVFINIDIVVWYGFTMKAEHVKSTGVSMVVQNMI